MYNKTHTIESKNKMTETRLKRYKSGVIKPTIHTEEYKKKLAERTTKKVDEESIFRLNGIGYSVNEIVRETGINRDIVIRRLKKYNLPSNSKKEKIVDMFVHTVTVCDANTGSVVKGKEPYTIKVAYG